jgi:hypothetical protein
LLGDELLAYPRQCIAVEIKGRECFSQSSKLSNIAAKQAVATWQQVAIFRNGERSPKLPFSHTGYEGSWGKKRKCREI